MMFLIGKKIFYLLLSCGVLFAFCLSNQNVCDYKTGDLNLDGKIDILDLNLLQHSLLQRNSLASIGDQNGDNKIDVIDLQILFNRLEKKWQGKRSQVPVAFVQVNSQSISNFCKGNIFKPYSGFVKETEYKATRLSPIPEDRGRRLKTEPYFLTGFLCHAPPVC
ncbi:MAG: dockerin type I repeat-containing protein [Candidatus Hydrogenedens sp.]